MRYLVLLLALSFSVRADDPPLLGPPLGLQDVFEISSDPNLGGCSADQVRALEVAYAECIAMATRIDDASTTIRFGLESPATGSIFDSLFNIASTQRRQQRNDPAIIADQTLGLTGITKMMRAIRNHAARAVRFNTPGNPITDKTRLHCSPSYLTFQTHIAFPDGTIAPLMSSTWNELGMLRSLVTGTVAELQRAPSQPDAQFPIDLASCGKVGFAFTSLIDNSITICPLVWGGTFNTNQNSYNFGLGLPTRVDDVAITDDISFLDNLRSLSVTLLHELCHLVARSEIDHPTIPGPMIETADEAHGFSDIHSVATDPREEGGVDVALAHPDSYALLGAALQRNEFDWRDGFARRPQFWQRRR